jgi:CDP-4-dehydro-6-deoxyglucose reductase
MELKTARLLESHDLAPEVRHFVFEVPGVERLIFEPGQYLSFRHEVDGEPLVRPYSIASPPNGRNRFELCLNRVPSGPFSNLLCHFQPGEEVLFAGPLGSFQLRQPVRDCLFVGVGTGIAPLRSMIGHLLGHGCTARLQLLFGARNRESLLYAATFEALARQHPNFEFHPTLSREGPSWTGLTGYVQGHLDALLGGRTDLTVYICGLKAMVNDVRARLEARGLDRHSIVYEKYN